MTFTFTYDIYLYILQAKLFRKNNVFAFYIIFFDIGKLKVVYFTPMDILSQAEILENLICP